MSTTHIDLGVTGMTCTSCSSRVERKLNKVDGVKATVNYATESASVEYDSTLTGPDDLIKVIQGAGYDAYNANQAADDANSLDDATGEDGITQSPADIAREKEAANLKRLTIMSGALSLPIMALSMIPALQVDYWQWVSAIWPPSSLSTVARLSIRRRGQILKAWFIHHGHAYHHGYFRGLFLVAVCHDFRHRRRAGHAHAHGIGLQ